MVDRELVEKAVKTIQMLAVDGVEKAASGHPGAPMGLASIAFELFTGELRFDPADPAWPDRDRFVLSCGHASMLLYATLHLCGYDVSLDDLKSFRQWGSRTPGHPEAHHTPGVETTTGPLGQGIANAVGMAIGQRMLAARFDSAEPGLFTGRVFGIASDGDMMEGVSGEACSLAGHLGLSNLIFFYDDNGITIDGSTKLAFTEDVGKRFEAYGWHVQRVDGHDHAEIRSALDRAVAEPARPSLIVAKTHIGYGAPGKQDSEEAHGSPLGGAEVDATKRAIGWPLEPTFLVPDDVRAFFAERARRGGDLRRAWEKKRDAMLARGGDVARLYHDLVERRVPGHLLGALIEGAPDKPNATRATSGAVQQIAARLVPALAGGSADLTPSNKTYIAGSEAIARGAFGGRNFHFGVREHGMAAIANGLALADGFIPYVSTFLVFADYMRPSIRLAALSKLQVLYVFTHDSVYLGEDGPTHQPVEHYWALRAIPNLDLWRPADTLECCAAWAYALERRDGPTAFALTRQGLPNLPRPAGFDPEDMLRGGYVIDDASGAPTAVVIATGSEVALAVEAKKLLGDKGRGLRVVSAPCVDQLLRQGPDYLDELLPKGVKRCSLELGITGPWGAMTGTDGLRIGHDDFGYSAPWQVIRDKLGMTPEAVAERIAGWL